MTTENTVSAAECIVSAHDTLTLNSPKHVVVLNWSELKRAIPYVNAIDSNPNQNFVLFGELVIGRRLERIWLEYKENNIDLTDLWPAIEEASFDIAEDLSDREKPVVIITGSYFLEVHSNGQIDLYDDPTPVRRMSGIPEDVAIEPPLLSMSHDELREMLLNIEEANEFGTDYSKLFGERLFRYSAGRITVEEKPRTINQTWKSIIHLHDVHG
jgi:hypothetical protein